MAVVNRSMSRFQYVEQDALDNCCVGVPVQVKLDSSSLFSVVKEVLNRATSVAEKCLLGKNQMMTLEMRTFPSIKCPLKVLKRINCAVACKADSELDVSASVIELLSNYSWAEKAVLTLAAFALSYGELLVYVDKQNLNTFASLISSLRRVDEIINLKGEEKFKTAITDLNAFTNLSVAFISLILHLEDLSHKDGIHDMSIVTKMRANVRKSSSLAIQFVVECLTQVNYITYEDRIMTVTGLSSRAESVEDELKTLNEIAEEYKSRKAEWEAYSRLHDCIRRGLGIVEVMKYMMYPSSEFYLDRCKGGAVKVDQVLKGNNVLLFISRLDNLSEADFSVLKTIYDKMLEENQSNYKIVWIPVLDSTRDLSSEELTKLDSWKQRMPWYVVSYPAKEQIVGIRYIKETWRFSYNPMVVVLDKDGAVDCLDAMHFIRGWGYSAFPFIPQTLTSFPGLDPIISPITGKEEIDKHEYIFLYGGGEGQAWSTFATNVGKLADYDHLGGRKFSPKPYSIGDEKNSITEEQFWARIESILCAKMQYWYKIGDVTVGQIQKLLSLKQDESGWAMLCKGSDVLVCSSGTLIIAAVSKYQEWVKNMDKQEFEVWLRDCLETLITQRISQSKKPRPCCHVPFQSLSGWIPVDVECPDCKERMERIVTYKCCHPKNSKKSLMLF